MLTSTISYTFLISLELYKCCLWYFSVASRYEINKLIFISTKEINMNTKISAHPNVTIRFVSMTDFNIIFKFHSMSTFITDANLHNIQKKIIEKSQILHSS